MRLSLKQQTLICETVAAETDDSVRIYVFGSRLQDTARGGDLDLLIESKAKLSLLQRARIKLSLEEHLGMPVGIISTTSTSPRTPFQEIAYSQGVLL
jgi:hypothetical protein